MVFCMIQLPPTIVANGLFFAHPSTIGSSDEEIIAISRREAPVERAAAIENLMQHLAFNLLHWGDAERGEALRVR